MKRNVWDKLSKKYDILWVQKYSLSPTRVKILELITEMLKEEKIYNILDLGCGTGQLIVEISKQFDNVKIVGVDKSKAMITIATKKLPNAKFYVADVCSENGSSIIQCKLFDFVICSHSFPYYDNKKEVIKKVKNLINEDGTAIFIQASINNLYDKIAMWFIEKTAEKADYLSKYAFIELVKDDFEVVEIFDIKKIWFMPTITGFVLRRFIKS